MLKLAERFLIWLLIMVLVSSCTKQLPSSFRFNQQQEAFSTNIEINTQIDLLWVVDNSSSMDILQKTLRDKIAPFAEAYMSPNWDIRIGVITTDAYLGNARFHGYIDSKILQARGFQYVDGSGVTQTYPGYQSLHLRDWIIAKVNAGNTIVNDPQLATLSTMGVVISNDINTAGRFDSGLKYGQLIPSWNEKADYARLKAGVRDGPIAAMCIERLPYFIMPNGVDKIGANCAVREKGANTGIASCLNPAGGESDVEQCVNTVLNNTVRSNSPMVGTLKMDDSIADAVWKAQLIENFMVNISAGAAGSGSERGLGSLLEFLNRNEGSDTQFFRAEALKGIIFLSDEDDQTMELPGAGNLSPFQNYKCDLPTLVDANWEKFGGSAVEATARANTETYLTTTTKTCCEGGSCSYTYFPANRCPEKMVDGKGYRVGICPVDSSLKTIASIKAEVDSYFAALASTDTESGDSSYFTVAIVPNKSSTLDTLLEARNESDDRTDNLQFLNAGSTVPTTRQAIRMPAVDVGQRYKDFVTEVGNGSEVYDIGENDYSVILDNIGKTLLGKKSRFKLKFEPTDERDMLIWIVHADASKELVDYDNFEIDGYDIVFTSFAFLLTLKESDKILIDYQPGSLDEE
jgi:hypothetical protein